MDISVSVIKKSISGLTKKLIKQGYVCEVYCFKSGHHQDISSSYVNLTVQDDSIGLYLDVRFIANGYSAVFSDDIATFDGMRKAKADFNKKLLKELDLRNK